MRSRFALALVLSASAAFAGVGQDSPAKVQSTIQSAMNGYSAAMKSLDSAKIESVIKANFAPEFKDTDAKGKVRTRDETIAAMKQNIGMLKSVKSVSLKITNVKVVGEKATTSEHMLLDAVIGGPGAAKPISLKVDSSWSGTYVKRGGKWLCVLSKGTKETVLIDGKKISG